VEDINKNFKWQRDTYEKLSNFTWQKTHTLEKLFIPNSKRTPLLEERERNTQTILL
jgi:hypothetical protein